MEGKKSVTDDEISFRRQTAFYLRPSVGSNVFFPIREDSCEFVSIRVPPSEFFEELGQVDRFLQDAVGGEGLDAVEPEGAADAGGDADAGLVAGCADFAEDIGAVAIGEHQGKNDGINGIINGGNGGGDGADDGDLVAIGSEQLAECVAGTRVVLDKKDALDLRCGGIGQGGRVIS
jgi:hypothetical protein